VVDLPLTVVIPDNHLFLADKLILNDPKEKVNGVVIESLPGTTFTVELEDGRKVLAYLAGKMRLNYIKVMPGDKVAIELSPDGARGRITFRF